METKVGAAGLRDEPCATCGVIAVWYTRADEHSKEIVSRRCDGAYLSGVLCADAQNECAERHGDQGAVFVKQYFEENSEGLHVSVSGNCVRPLGTDFSRQLII